MVRLTVTARMCREHFLNLLKIVDGSVYFWYLVKDKFPGKILEYFK